MAGYGGLSSLVLRSAGPSELRWVLAIAVLVSLAALFAQGKGWRHHWQPVHASPEEMGRFERSFFEAVVTDLHCARPTLTILDTLPPGYVLHGFSYLEHFGQDPRFTTCSGNTGSSPPWIGTGS